MKSGRGLYCIILLLRAAALASLQERSVSAQEKILKVTENELRSAVSQKIEPEYPAVARQIRLTGDVDLEVVIDNTGSVEKVTVLRGNALLVGSSIQAIKRWRFTPFRVDGQVTRAVGQIRFNFQI